MTDAQEQPPETADRTAQVLDPVVLSSAYIIDKQADEVFALNGRTQEREFTGVAGEDDAAVIQAAFDGLDGGGRVFIRNNEYSLSERIELGTGRAEVLSDFARLTFHDRANAGGEVQIDFAIGRSVEEPARFIRVAGLIVDGNKSERTTPTRTMDIFAGTEHLTIERCVVYGGQGTEGGEGYGIGESRNTDYISLHNCVIRDSDRHAYHPSADHTVITSSTFINNAINGPDIFDLSGRAIVTNNHFKANGHGVNIAGAGDANVVIANNLFEDNFSEDDETTGQLQMWGAGAQSITVTGNEFRLPTSTDSREMVKHVDGRIGHPEEGPRNIETLRIADNHFAGGQDSAIKFITLDETSYVDKLVVENNTFDTVGKALIIPDRTLKFIVRNNVFDQSTGPTGELMGHEGIASGVVSGNLLYDAEISDSLRNGEAVMVNGNTSFPAVSEP